MLIIKIRNNKIWPWLLLYTGTTIFIYLFSVSPLFSYSYLTTHINMQKCIICFLLYIITLLCLPKDVKRASTYLFYLIYLITYVPTLMYTWMNNEDIRYIVYLTISILTIEVLIRKFKGISLSVPHVDHLFLLIFGVYIISSLFLVIRNGGINPNTLLISRVSSTREGIEGGVWGYLLNWCAKSFSPMLFAYFAYKKKWLWVFVVCVIQALLYFSFGFKAFLFSIALLILISYVLRKGTDYFRLMPGFFALINIISYFFYKFDISKLPLFTFAYRTLFIPAQTQFQYFNFFSTNKHLLFSEGIIGRLFGIKYPYSMPIGYIVNQSVYGANHYSNGNTGIFAYGYADCGLFGMILASFVLVSIFLIVDGLTKKLPLHIVVAAMSYQMFILNDTNILISLNTGGILWTVLLLIIIDPVISRNNNDSISNNKLLKSILT